MTSVEGRGDGMLERWNNGRMQTLKKRNAVFCGSNIPVVHYSNSFIWVSSVASCKEVTSVEG